MVHDRFFFALVNPILALLFAFGFALIWLKWREYRHLPALSAAFLCLGTGFIFTDFKLLLWPDEVNIGANILYVLAVTLACSATLLRRKFQPPFMLYAAIIVSGTLPFAWYLVVEPSLFARILITSAVFVAVTSATFFLLIRQEQMALPDKLFAAGVGLAFCVAVIRPTLVFTGVLDVDAPGGFIASDYWASIRAFTPLMSFAIATIFVVAIGLDVVEHLKGQADRDYLTGLLNRRGFETAGGQALDKDLAEARQPAMMVADIDDFKKVNDTFGHKIGDGVIAGVAKVLAGHAQARLAGRIGGEEFALYFTDMSRAELQDLAKAIQTDLTSIQIPGLPADYPVTLSIGLHLSYGRESLPDLMARADQALYRAKREGKDQAVMTAVQLHLAPLSVNHA